MLVIRLQRTGRHNLAAYRVVVAEKSKAVKKEAIEVVGHYLPTQTPKVIEINVEKVHEWISKGAQPSETVASLLKNNGVAGMEKYLGKPNRTAKRKKALPEEPAAKPAPQEEAAAPEETVEAPAPEVADAPEAPEAPAAPEVTEEVTEAPIADEPEAQTEAPAEVVAEAETPEEATPETPAPKAEAA